MPFFGVPFDSQDVMFWIFYAVRQFIGQTMAGRFEGCASFFVGRFESFASRRLNLVPRIFNNHALPPDPLGKSSATKDYRGISFASGNVPYAIPADLRYPLLLQLLFDRSELASPVGTIL